MRAKKNQDGKAVTAALYVRVSTKKQAEKGYSLEEQDEALREYCARQCWEVADVFIDKGESGRIEDRPEFQRMLKFCKQRHVVFVVVYDLSRFARKMEVQAQALLSLRNCGTQIRSVREPNVDDTPTGKYLANMIGATNQYFSDALSDRMQRSAKESRLAGRWPRRAPLGYKNVKAIRGEANIVPDEAAPFIDRAFTLYATGSYTKTEILHILNNEGFKNKNGNPVPMQTFVEMLRNPVYIGFQRSRQDDELMLGLWRPITDGETFRNAQLIDTGRKPTTTPHTRRRPDFPLRITLLCEGCGKPLTGGKARGRNGKQFAYYWCRTRGCRKVKSIKVGEIDAQFVKLLQRLKANPDFVAKFLPAYERVLRAREDDSKAEIRALKVEIEEKERQLKELDRTRYVEKDIPEDTYRQIKADLLDELDGLRERLGYIGMPQAIRELQWAFSRNVLLDVSQGWERGTVEQRQMFQKVLFPRGIKVSSTGHIFEPDNDTLFSHLEHIAHDFINLASPAGFEPALPP